MKLFKNEYETVLANNPEEAKKVIQNCIDDHLAFEEIDNFELCKEPVSITYELWKYIPKCIRNLNTVKLEMAEFPYYGEGEFFKVTIPLEDWEKIADSYIQECHGAFVATLEF